MYFDIHPFVQQGGFTKKFSLSQRTGTLLPEFPNANFLLLPHNLPRDKVGVCLLLNSIVLILTLSARGSTLDGADSDSDV